jgi:hypothetical protein
MKSIKVTVSFAVISLLLNSCNLPANTASFQANRAKEKANVQASTDSSSKQEKNENSQISLPDKSVENLSDGNYRLCTEPSSPQLPESQQIDGWCLRFTKQGKSIVGVYAPFLHKGDAQICIDGIVEGNKVRGSGYEIVEGGSEPVRLTQEDLTRFHGNGVRDADGSLENKSNLRVNVPQVYRTGKYSDASNRYYAWVKYDNIMLDLDKFFRRNPGRYAVPKKCPNY